MIDTFHILLAFGASILVVGGLIGITHIILNRTRAKRRFSDIIRDDGKWPSLAVFQFLLWTIVISVSFLTIYLIRIFGGVLDFPSGLPNNILILMGISTAVPIISKGVSNVKKNVVSMPASLPSFSTMLEDENQNPTLTRFQMFSWTFISIIIYLIILVSKITDPGIMANLSTLQLPDVDSTLVVLMGLSQGAYLGGKMTLKKGSSVN